MAAFALPIIGGLSSLLGGFIGSGAAKQAAGVEAGTMGRNAEQLAEVGGQQLQGELGAISPYANWGRHAFNVLQQQLQTPGQGLLSTYQPFQAPTGLNFQNDPGYQARMALGEQAIQNSAAARGDIFSGNTMKALEDYGQTFGSEEYGNVYNRALQNYMTNAQNFYTGQGNTYNRLMGAGQTGLQATGMGDQARQFYQNLYGNGMEMSNQAGEAKAAGIMGGANAWQNALGGVSGNAQFAGLLNMLNPSGASYMQPYSGPLMTPQSLPTYSSGGDASLTIPSGGPFVGAVP